MFRLASVIAIDREEVDSSPRVPFRDGVDPSTFVEMRVLPLGKDLLDLPGMLDQDSHPTQVLSSTR
eukprot:2509762-Heterocapsa_arctica.AAC.1